MADPYLSQPLLSTGPTAAAAAGKDDAEDNNPNFSSSNNSIISRLLVIIFIGVISIWANFEASKGFHVDIINESKDSLAGKRFELLYISNDKATRILLNTSAFVENILYPDSNNYTKKEVHRVILRFASWNNVTSRTVVDVKTNGSSEFIISLSPSIMAHANVNYEVISALQRGMARIWLWDGESLAPPWLMDGLVEYISMLAGFGEGKDSLGGELPEFGERCWDDKDARVVALFLDYCEGNNKGFIQRLNQALRERWNYNRTVAETGALRTEAKC